MLGDFPRYAWHVRGTPHKHISICTENVDEHYFLFGVEAGTDPQCPAFRGLRVEEDELGHLRRLEAPGAALGVGDILSKAIKVGDQGHYLHHGLGLLNALNVALAGVLAHHADGDDTVGSWHLEFEVGVVGEGHELGITYPSQDHVVGS